MADNLSRDFNKSAILSFPITIHLYNVPQNSTQPKHIHSMYEYELEITINKKSFFKTITADTQHEALDFGHMMYPHADFIDLA